MQKLIGWALALSMTCAVLGSAHADSLVVQNCQTVPTQYAPGSTRLDVVDINGQKCTGTSGTRPFNATASVTFGTAYAVNQNIGGLLTVSTGLQPNTPVIIDNGFVNVFAGTATAVSSVAVYIFNSLPSGTFADTVVPTFVTGDVAKLRAAVNTGAPLTTITSNVILAMRIGTAAGNYPVDASGNLYIALIANGTFTLASVGAGQVNLQGRW